VRERERGRERESEREREREREKCDLYDEGCVGAVFVQEGDMTRLQDPDCQNSYLACMYICSVCVREREGACVRVLLCGGAREH
jgi:hypothetical protein